MMWPPKFNIGGSGWGIVKYSKQGLHWIISICFENRIVQNRHNKKKNDDLFLLTSTKDGSYQFIPYCYSSMYDLMSITRLFYYQLTVYKSHFFLFILVFYTYRKYASHYKSIYTFL